MRSRLTTSRLHLTADEYPEEEFSDEDYEEDSEEYSEEAPEEEPEESFSEAAAADGDAESDEASQTSEISEPESADLIDEGNDNDGSDGILTGEEPAGEDTEISSGSGEDETDEPSENEEAKAFVPIGMENLAELHNQLIQFYGDDGKDVYQSLKSGTLTIEKKDWDKAEKFLYYCVLIFRHSDVPQEELSEENISEFAQFLLGAENKRKNLNSLRYALLKHYGKEKGRRYYFMLKPYVKALNQM